MSDLHQEVGSPGVAEPEVSWKPAPRRGEDGGIRAREETQGELACGGPWHQDVRGSDGAEAVLSL